MKTPFAYLPGPSCIVRLLLPALLLMGFAVPPVVRAQTTGIARELFRNLSTNDNTYATTVVFTNRSPNSTSTLADFEAPSNNGEAFGDRLRGFILPAFTGDHVFSIASDEWSDLFLSSDESPSNRVRIAFVNEATRFREFGREPNQTSQPVFLKFGRRYYIEAVRKEGGGPDHLSVRWLMPDGSVEEPIPGKAGAVVRLLPFRTNTVSLPALLTPVVTNLVVLEGRPIDLVSLANNPVPVTYQWQLNQQDIPGATESLFSIPSAVVGTHHDQRYRCVLLNGSGPTTTAEFHLTVLADTVAPEVAQIILLTATRLQVRFTEPITPASGSLISNFGIDGGIVVMGAGLEGDSTVILTTSPMTYGSSYRLTLSGIQDRMQVPNPIPAGTRIPFTAVDFASEQIGSAAVPGTAALVDGGFDLSIASRDIAGAADQFHYNWQQRTGDFDVEVRVQALLNFADAWAKAGIMARATLTTNSPFAMVASSPGVQGSYFLSRAVISAAPVPTGSFPSLGSNTWLRLKRAGNVFAGYASFDGNRWAQLGSASVGMPATVFLGMAAASRVTNQVITAQFRDFADTGAAPGVEMLADVEPPGPSSRTGPIAFTEIMFQSTLRPDLTNSLEFIEIYNSNPFFEDLSGYRIRGDIEFDFPAGSVMPGGSYWVIARDPAALRAAYNLDQVLGPFTGSLKSSGVVRLEDKIRAVMLEVPYLDRSPWPVAADGTGHSLVLARPSYGERTPLAWDISDVKGGSPGRFDVPGVEPLRDVVINEFLANSASPLTDFIELYNRGSGPVDLSGAWLSDSPATNFFRIPDGTLLAPGGIVHFQQSALNFGLNAEGEAVYLHNPSRTRVIDAIRFGAQRPNVSTGRFPNGDRELYPMASRTPGSANEGILIHDVVINEIMYKPITSDEEAFVELYNQGSQPVDVGGWRFVHGIDYTFPAGVTLASKGFLVVARNRTNLIARHPGVLTLQNTHGDYQGRATREGNRIALAMAVPHVSVNASGVASTNLIFPVVDEVTFGRGGRWGEWANGDGSSLELRDPRSNHRLAYNWGDSDDRGEAPWTTIESTGLVDNGSPQDGSVNRLELTLLGMGECLVDNVEVLGGNIQASRLVNGTFESGLSPWTPQGDHVRSTLEDSEGYQSSRSLRVRATARGDTGANRIRVALSGSIPDNQLCTIRARVRWLRGWPELVLRLEGNGFELAGRMQLPTTLGTPGARNSIAVDNAPPAISNVRHTPVLPAANQPALVTAQVQDPDGLSGVTLAYRVDPGSNVVDVAMNDLGQEGDLLAGDGIHSALIPGQSAGTLVGFHIRATDGAPGKAASLLPHDAPVRECLVRFGEPTPASGYATYHYHLTERNVATWINRPSLSNERIEGTFVYGNFRAIYNISGKYSGSPYHQGFNSPVTDPCHYSLELPMDDILLGTENFNKLHAPGNGAFDDGSLQREQTAYWLMRAMDLPYNYRRFFAMYVNGRRKGTFMEDTQTPGSDVVDQRFPDDNDGHLYKLQPWFEFDDVNTTAGGGAGFLNVSWCTLLNFYTGPQRNIKKLARYRYNYLTRAANLTANDYTNVWDLTDAANTPAGGDYIGNMKNLVDMDQWTRTFAVQHGVGNWDSFGNRNSQNMYGYKPENGRWQLMTWDFNIVLGNSGSDGPTGDDLFQYNSADPAMLRLYQTPEFRRMYLRSLKELAEGPMRSPLLQQLMTAKHAEFINSGQTASNPTEIWTWLQQRISYLQTAVRAYQTNFTVAGTNRFETNGALVVIQGTAPLEIVTVTVNGKAYPLTWLAQPGSAIVSTLWRVTLPLGEGENVLVIEGRDRLGNVVPGAGQTNTIHRLIQPPDPRGTLVFSEIMYNPVFPDASFLEIHNKSLTDAYELSGWRVDGVDYRFPDGAVITPGQYLVLVRDRAKFVRAYGGGAPVFDTYNGGLANEGEVISLVKPGATPAEDVVIDRVRFESALPWTQAANGGGVSLQLIDRDEDNSRVSNWDSAGEPEWQRLSVTSTNRGRTLLLSLPLPGDVHVDDVSLIDAAGGDVVVNGGFESPLAGSWIVSTNNLLSEWSSTVARTGSRSLRLRASGASGASTNQAVWQITAPILTNAVYTLSLYYLPTTGAVSIAARTLPGGGLSVSNAVAPVMQTPGARNNITLDLPEYAPIWLNEILPYNRAGRTDAQGDRDAWVEILNAGSTSVSLDGYHLTDDYGDLSRWPFPAGVVVEPGEFRWVWLDGEPEFSSPAELHSSITPSLTNGSIALTRVVEGRLQVVDFLNYSLLGADESFGSFPDGQPFYRQKLVHATQGAANDGTPPQVRINEWLADNTSVLANPVGGRFSDWFELYNPSDTAADLTGFFLSENPNNRNQFPIPAGTFIPARGHLLVWADNQGSANTPGAQDLHANFALNKRNGGSLILFSPNGNVVDSVEFGAQSNNISMGRFPDGGDDVRFLVRPTPRAANVFGPGGNTAPTLGDLPDRSIPEESRLAFPALATDAESDPAHLFYSLEAAPAGASILPDGRFRWRPTEMQGPGMYSVTVRVTDPGNPPLFSSRTFRVSVSEVNKPPVFDLRARYGKVGQVLSFATAVDPDLPTQSLRFELLDGAPAAAQIHPATGVVTWTPTAGQVGRHTVAVKVVDDGNPAQTASHSYLVEVVADTAVLLVGRISLNGNQVIIDCQNVSGSKYRLEFSPSLGSPNWQPLGAVVAAIGGTVSFTDGLSSEPARYYRIVQVE